MLLIYTPKLTARLEYAFRLVFHEVLGTDYSVTSDAGSFDRATGYRLIYDKEHTGESIRIIPCGLKTETGIREQDLNPGTWEDMPVIFSNENPGIPFDLFAAVFYLVSRYEEYLPFDPDEHGRFPAGSGIAHKCGMLRLPIVDLWCVRLAQTLGIEEECPNIREEHAAFRLTVDIDQPWLYRHKGGLYSAGALLRDLLTLNFSGGWERISVLLRMRPDPGDSYDYLLSQQRELSHPIKFFVLCRGKKEHDKNRSVGRRGFKTLLRRLDGKGQLGIHPSYASHTDKRLLKEEIGLLSKILGREISTSRQHYLKLRFPETFRELIYQGITEDYSLGYSTKTGFRSGIARSHNFYDLGEEKETGLRLTPLIIMERTLKDSLGFGPEEAIEEFRYYNGQIKRVGGEFVCLWHNDAVSDRGEWRGWRRAFEEMINIQESI